MSEIDLVALEHLAEGDGEMRVSKKLMRSLLEKAKPSGATGRTIVPVDRIGGSVR